MDFSKINFNKDVVGEHTNRDSKTSDSDKSLEQDTKPAAKASLNFGNLNLGGAPRPMAQPSHSSANEASAPKAPVETPAAPKSTSVDDAMAAHKTAPASTSPARTFIFPKTPSSPVSTPAPVVVEPTPLVVVEPTNVISQSEESLSKTVENPLLDDDDDEFITTPSAARDRSASSWDRSSRDEADEDDAPFLGFSKVQAVVESKLESVTDFDDGFDEQFEDLLEDETYEATSRSDENFFKTSEGTASSSTSADVASAREAVRKNSSSEVEVDSETKSDFEKRLVERKEARETRDANRPKGQKKTPTRARLESEFVRQDPKEVLVDSYGRPVLKDSESFDKSFTNTTNAKKAVGDKQRYRYMRPDGKLNGAELEFFKNAQVSRTSALSNPSEIERLRGPVNRNETEAERRERSKHITRVAAGRKGMERGKSPRFGQKEREVLEFLAMFRYATDQQLARMFSESTGTAYNRLKRLRQQGLVIDKKIYGNRPIWFLTDAGLIISGYDLPRITESKLTFSMFPHQFTVNNTAANLWGANIDVLGLPDYPSKNRLNSKSELSFGENLVSELEIQSSFGKVKSFEKADVFRPALLSNIDREFAKWKNAGGPESGSSPEMHYGNEYMWSLMPPYNIHLAYHVPDLVIKRDRNTDGSPNSIAVEIEISNKAADSYEKTLLAYKADKRLYSKVIWVCKSAGPAGKLERIAKDIGLWQEGRIDVVPIVTETGVFKDRDLWTI